MDGATEGQESETREQGASKFGLAGAFFFLARIGSVARQHGPCARFYALHGARGLSETLLTIGQDRFVSKLFLRGDSVILGASSALACFSDVYSAPQHGVALGFGLAARSRDLPLSLQLYSRSLSLRP